MQGSVFCSNFATSKLLSHNMNRQILRLAVPSIISNITVPLLGLVDVAITGHMGETRYMAAIAVGSMLFNLIYWLFSFLRFGTGGMTAQACGMADGDEKCRPLAAYILCRSLLTAFGIAMLITVLQIPLFSLAMWFIQPDANLVDTIHTYYNICIWGTPAALSLYVLTGWFVGMQDTRVPMLVSVGQNIVNILLSCFFVYVLKMKIEGVALGTLCAQWAGALAAFALAVHKCKAYTRSVVWDNGMLRQLRRSMHVSRVNVTLFIRTLFLIAVNMYFVQAGARGGAVILAVNSVLMQMFILYTYVMDGFAFAAEALCGRYHGAADNRGFSLALRGVWIWSLLLTAAYTLVYAVGGQSFLAFLTDDAAVRSAAVEYLPWAVAIPVCGVAAFVWDGVFVGLTMTVGMMWGTFGGAVAFFLIYFSLYDVMSNHALWFAFNAYLFMRGVVQTIVYYMGKK